MSITNILKTVAMKERCDTIYSGVLALQLIDPAKNGIIDVNFNFIVGGAEQISAERVEEIANDLVTRVKTFEAELRAAYPDFVFSIDGNAAGLKAEFESPEHRAKFETKNAENLAKAKADHLASENDEAKSEA